MLSGRSGYLHRLLTAPAHAPRAVASASRYTIPRTSPPSWQAGWCCRCRFCAGATPPCSASSPPLVLLSTPIRLRRACCGLLGRSPLHPCLLPLAHLRHRVERGSSCAGTTSPCPTTETQQPSRELVDQPLPCAARGTYLVLPHSPALRDYSFAPTSSDVAADAPRQTAAPGVRHPRLSHPLHNGRQWE
jgi:hypothetical protein